MNPRKCLFLAAVGDLLQIITDAGTEDLGLGVVSVMLCSVGLSLPISRHLAAQLMRSI